MASPFVLYQVWGFIAPGLYKSRAPLRGPFMISTVGLFVAGGYFAYKVVYPGRVELLLRIQHAVHAHDHDQRVHRVCS